MITSEKIDYNIIGEKMRLGSQGKPHEAFSRKGKYQKLDNGLEIKEVIIGGDSEARRRFVIVRNLEEARRDSQKRQRSLKRWNAGWRNSGSWMESLIRRRPVL